MKQENFARSKSSKISGGILFFYALFFLASCANDELNEANFSGEWQVTDYSADVELSPMIIMAAKQVAITTSYSFNSDGTFLQKDISETQGLSGTWKLLKDKNQVELIYTNNEVPLIYTIQDFSSDKMSWLHQMGDLGTEEYSLEKK